MSPTRNPDSNFSLDDTLATGGAPSAPAPAIPKGRTKKRAVFVPLTTDGKLDVDRVRDSAELEAARSALGVVDPATLPPAVKPTIRKEYILPAFSLLEVAIRFLGKQVLKWPNELTVEMHFDEQKKQAMVEPTSAIIATYAPGWLIENQDMAALGAMLTDAIDDMINKGVARYQAKVRAAQNPQPPPIPPQAERVFTSVPQNGASVAA